MAAEPPKLVEHFFRQESAKLISVLTRAFGVRYLDLIEDNVQEAMMAAVKASRHALPGNHRPKNQGLPENLSGWIYRVARNRTLDALRREKIHRRALDLARQTEEGLEQLMDQWVHEDELPDSMLRMIFVCAHPSLDRPSQIALTLKILCGFSLAEIARGLLTSTEAIKKRVQRAKAKLAEEQIRAELPAEAELRNRLSVVQEVLYLLFNEGYSTSQGHDPIRDDICEQAAWLCHLLCQHRACNTADTRALMSLMLAHSARLDARVDASGKPVLLADQDRSRWDHGMIRLASAWLERSKTPQPSRFHLEAGVALAHGFAPSLQETDWSYIVALYDRLLTIHESPLYVLNRAIARGETGEIERALAELESIRGHPKMGSYFLLDCAKGRLLTSASRTDEAIAAYERALSAATAPHERALLEKRLDDLRDPPP